MAGGGFGRFGRLGGGGNVSKGVSNDSGLPGIFA